MSWSEVALVVLVTAVLTAFLVGYFTWRYARRAGEFSQSDINVLEAGSALIDVIATAGLIVDYTDAVVRSSASASAMGLVRKKKISNPAILRLVDDTRKQGRPIVVEMELRGTSKKEVRLFEVKTVIASNRNVVVLLDDKTESRRLDQARQDFLANISHELKTPIGAIGLLAEALIDATDDPETVKKFSANLRTESRRLAELVKGIIQLSRVQTVDVLAEALPVRGSDLVAEAIQRCAVLADSKRIAVEPNCPDSLWVAGDVELLTVAVKNLIDNAISYSETDTTVRVGVTATKTSVRFAVSDTGVGIPQDERDRVFERFYRVDPSRSRVTGGTGLGLSLVKHICLSHGGDVAVVSEVGAGSTFTMTLPRYEPQQPGVSL
jgi:two-component system sensor histidine kinase SenX3